MTSRQFPKKISTYTTYTKTAILLRLLFGPSIFIAPHIATLVNVLLDAFDGELFKESGYARSQYSIYDKILDYYWYVWILLYILMSNVPHKSVFIGLFLYRSVGQMVFLYSNKGIILFLFPNMFEKLFILYIFLDILGLNALFSQESMILPMLLVIYLIAIFLEYIVHLKHINLSGTYMGKTTYWVKKTLNPYKPFLFLSLIVSITVIANQVITVKNTQQLSIQAKRAQKNGVILRYDPVAGNLSGMVSTAQYRAGEAVIYSTPEFKTPVCRQTNITLTTLATGFGFTFTGVCVKDLPDGQYWLLLFTDKNQETPASLLPFTIKGGVLSP